MFAINELADLIAIVVFVFCAVMIGMSGAIFSYYLKYKHRYLLHIALMALSYLIFVSLVGAAMNFRIFYEGRSRMIGSLFAIAACILGFTALMLIFSRRQKDLVKKEVLERLKEAGHLTEDSVREAELEIEGLD